MDRLILLIGPSGSLKTTIAKELEKHYNIIQSYTTRKPRHKDEWGHTFINYANYKTEDYEGSKKKIEVINEEGKTDTYIALAYMESYDDIYFMTQEQYKNKGTSIYVVDAGGAEMVYENVKDASVLAIFLTCDRNERMYRMLNRGDSMDDVEYRLKKDASIFSRCKCDFVIDANRNLDKVFADVVNIIANERI